MDVRNCKSCGKLFSYIGGAPLCPKCRSGLEEKFQEVKIYVEENPTAPISQVAEENDVTIQQLKRWVKEERLAFSDASLIGINCESCGAMIKTGRFCQSCKERMHGDLSNMYRSQEPAVVKKQKESARMRFLDNK